MKRLNEPTLTFEVVTINLPEKMSFLERLVREPKTTPIHCPGRSTWNKLELQFDSIDEVEFGKQQVFEDDLWIIHMLVTEVDQKTLRGTAYIDHAIRKETTHA